MIVALVAHFGFFEAVEHLRLKKVGPSMSLAIAP